MFCLDPPFFILLMTAASGLDAESCRSLLFANHSVSVFGRSLFDCHCVQDCSQRFRCRALPFPSLQHHNVFVSYNTLDSLLRSTERLFFPLPAFVFFGTPPFFLYFAADRSKNGGAHLYAVQNDLCIPLSVSVRLCFQTSLLI